MNKPTPLKEEDLQEWLSHPVTQALRAWLESAVRQHQAAWASGQYLSAGGTEQTLMANVRAVGECGMAREVLDLTLDQLNEALDEENE